MSTNEDYLNVPMYDVSAFYLLKTNSTCPKLYSYASTEESVLMDEATISPGLGDNFANSSNGTLKITFCRYSYGKNLNCVPVKQNVSYTLRLVHHLLYYILLNVN